MRRGAESFRRMLLTLACSGVASLSVGYGTYAYLWRSRSMNQAASAAAPVAVLRATYCLIWGLAAGILSGVGVALLLSLWISFRDRSKNIV